jgi:multicomponent Na+:H+ antiporter subunit D
MTVLPALPVALPLLVAAALAATATWVPWRRGADVAALGTAVAVTVLCVLLLVRSTGDTIVYWFGGWEPRDGIALGISFTIDPISAGLAAFAGLLTSVALLVSWRHFGSVGQVFHALMLVFLAAMVGFSLSGDLFNMFVFFELMSISAIALTGYEIDERPAINGSLNFAITNSIGGFLVLSGIALIYGRTGALNLAQIGETLASSSPDGLIVVAFALLVAGFFVKAAVVPFHFWLADAYAVAPTSVCILFAGVMSELGLYAIARIYWTAFSGVLGPQEVELQAILVGAGIVTALIGAVMCFLQHHLKRLLAFANVSFVGLFLIGIGLLTPDGLAGSAVYVLGDGLVKASLFVCVGILQHQHGRLDELRLRGLGRDLPFTGAIFAVGGLALASLPPFGTFLGKSMLKEATLEQGYTWVLALITLASILIGAAVLRAAGRVFLGWDPEATHDRLSEQADQDTEPEMENEPEMEKARNRTPKSLSAAALGLLLMALAVGLTPGLAYAAQEAAARFLDHNVYTATVLYGLPTDQPSVGPPHALTGTDFLYAIASTGGAIALALLALFGQHLPQRTKRRSLAAVWEASSSRLRTLHSGHPGDYVAWLTLGVAIFGVLFALTLR